MRREANSPRPFRATFPVHWAREALGALSRPRVMVCKSAHVMSVLDGERCVKSYRVAVGGGKGDKRREGDRCTPEGEFCVCLKNPDSDYILSLGLSYPNEEDAARGLRDGLIGRAEHDAIVEAIRRGDCPPWKTALGGEIMIHGCRADRDWTLGCIALDDDDIREVYPALPLGTPVTILP
ncbi:MAG TPA: L,D-transpeptidase family protein [Phycisphaerae bacterium]|nr:L,D-transpeptidase family protein [Phycisphaerae bacterium]